MRSSQSFGVSFVDLVRPELLAWVGRGSAFQVVGLSKSWAKLFPNLFVLGLAETEIEAAAGQLGKSCIPFLV